MSRRTQVSITNPNNQGTLRSDMDMPAPMTGTAAYVVPEADTRETKGSFKTTELWLTLAGVAALIVLYNVADDPSLDLWRTALLCTALGVAYIISRGLAKGGTVDRRVRTNDRR